MGLSREVPRRYTPGTWNELDADVGPVRVRAGERDEIALVERVVGEGDEASCRLR